MDKSSEHDIVSTVRALEALVRDGSELEKIPQDLREALMKAAGRLVRPNRLELRLRNKEIRRAKEKRRLEADRSARNSTGIREARKAAVFTPPAFWTEKHLKAHV